jgi:hypothetical protein
VTEQSSDANETQMVVMERTNQCQCKAEQMPGERYKEKTRVKAKYAVTASPNVDSGNVRIVNHSRKRKQNVDQGGSSACSQALGKVKTGNPAKDHGESW